MSGSCDGKYVGEVSGTILKIRPVDPDGDYTRHRQVAAFVYELAAALERLCDETGTNIVVSPEAFDARIVLETVQDGDEAVVADLLQGLLAEHEFTGSAS